MNYVCEIGRLTAEPELYADRNGNAIAKYRLAVDRRVKHEGQPTADFIPCKVFGAGANFVKNYLHKGTKIAVIGRIQTGSYEKDGQRISTFEVVVDQHEFCESKNSNESQADTDEYGFSGVSADDVFGE